MPSYVKENRSNNTKTKTAELSLSLSLKTPALKWLQLRSIKRVLRIRIHAPDPALCSEASFQRRLAPSGIQQGLTKQTPLMVNDSFRARAEREEIRAVVRQVDRAAAQSPSRHPLLQELLGAPGEKPGCRTPLCRPLSCTNSDFISNATETTTFPSFWPKDLKHFFTW